MKLSNNEATLLAKEVLEQLKKKNLREIPSATIQKIKAYKEKYRELEAAVKKAETNLEAHESAWEDIVGNKSGIYASDSMPYLLKKLKESDMPALSEIRDKILLKGLFNKDEDMETFVESIVRAFTTKKKQSQSA